MRATSPRRGTRGTTPGPPPDPGQHFERQGAVGALRTVSRSRIAALERRDRRRDRRRPVAQRAGDCGAGRTRCGGRYGPREHGGEGNGQQGRPARAGSKPAGRGARPTIIRTGGVQCDSRRGGTVFARGGAEDGRSAGAESGWSSCRSPERAGQSARSMACQCVATDVQHREAHREIDQWPGRPRTLASSTSPVDGGSAVIVGAPYRWSRRGKGLSGLARSSSGAPGLFFGRGFRRSGRNPIDRCRIAVDHGVCRAAGALSRGDRPTRRRTDVRDSSGAGRFARDGLPAGDARPSVVRSPVALHIAGRSRRTGVGANGRPCRWGDRVAGVVLRAVPGEAAFGGAPWRRPPLPDPRGGASGFAPGAAGRRPDRLPGRRGGRDPALGCGRWPVAVDCGSRHEEHLRGNRHPAGEARLATQVGYDQRSTELRIGAGAAR